MIICQSGSTSSWSRWRGQRYLIMLKRTNRFHHSLVSKLILTVGLVSLLSISTWAYFNINFQKKKFMDDIVIGTDRLTNTIRLGAHYAMMLNSRDDIIQIINNIGRQKEIETIRIYNKDGQIKFSNITTEVDSKTNIEAEACYICHRSEPPLSKVGLPRLRRPRVHPHPRPAGGTAPSGTNLRGVA